MAVRGPIPPMNAIGTRNPKSARLGMVCAMFAAPMIQRRAFCRRASQIPPGTAMATAIAIAINTISRCSIVSETTSDMSDMGLLFEPGQECAGFGRIGASKPGGRQDQFHHTLVQQSDARAHAQRLAYVVRDEERRLANLVPEVQEE